jgi:phage gp16-like protein
MSAKQIAAETLRKRSIGTIHGLAKKLGIDDDTRKQMQERVTGVSSTAEMTAAQLDQVLAELKRMSNEPGFKFDVHRDEPKDLAKSPMLKKVQALLAEAGRPWSYVHGMAKRMFKTARVEWLRDADLHKVVAALQADANRRIAHCRTITFEDMGQDFLEWDVDDKDVVVGCRPFQAWVWCGTQIMGDCIHPGSFLRIRTKLGNEYTLRHKVVSVEAAKQYSKKA